MKRSITRVICFLCVLFFGLTSLAGCSTSGSKGKKVDPNKTQIYIGAVSQGINEAWLDPFIEEFEREYPEYQVFVDALSGEEVRTLADDMPASRDDLFFVTQTTYPTEWIENGLIDDITDVVTQGDERFDDGRTIESKIRADVIDTYQTEVDGATKYYGIPYVLAFYGIIYDADLFTEKQLYNLPSNKGLDGVLNTDDDQWGPDGRNGTYDDGLPATWADFKAMMDTMVQKNITPFCWTGAYTYYHEYLAQALIADYEGVDQHRLWYTLNGHDDYTGEDITIDKGYLLATRESKKAVIQFAYELTKTDSRYFDSKSFLNSQTHLGAQNTFVTSTLTNQPIAMLVDGSWWENEAKATLNEMTQYDTADRKYGYGQRDFRVMPLPRLTNMTGITTQPQTEETVVVSDFGGSIVCLNANSKHKDAAKLFLRYVHTDKALKGFTQDNGLLRPFDYEFTDEELKNVSKFSQSAWKYLSEDHIRMTDKSTPDPTINAFLSYIGNMQTRAKHGTININDPFDAFFTGTAQTVDEYLGFCQEKYSAEEWAKNVTSKM